MSQQPLANSAAEISDENQKRRPFVEPAFLYGVPGVGGLIAG